VTIGSELAAMLHADPADPPTDLGRAVSAGLATVRPGLVELARLGSTELAGLDAAQSLDAVLDIEKQQAWRADLDHITAFPQGRTTASNLHPLHRRHHNAKTEAGWQAERNPDTGHTQWTSPQGRCYQTRPPQRWAQPDDDPPF
jgi:hypothetical protein